MLMPILALALVGTPQRTQLPNSKVRPLVVAWLPTLSKYVSSEPNLAASEAIAGADFGLARPAYRQRPYTAASADKFRAALTAAGVAEGATSWDLTAAREAAKSVGADYVGGLTIDSARPGEGSGHSWITIKGTLLVIDVASPNGTQRRVTLEARQYEGPTASDPAATVPTIRAAATRLAQETVPKWFVLARITKK